MEQTELLSEGIFCPDTGESVSIPRTILIGALTEAADDALWRMQHFRGQGDTHMTMVYAYLAASRLSCLSALLQQEREEKRREKPTFP